MKKISMRKTVLLDPLLRKHERHMSCYCTFQIAPNMNDFFFYIMSRLNCHSEPITVYGKNSETVARRGVRILSRLGFHD